MNNNNYNKLQERIDDLEKENQRLVIENERLLKKVEFFENHPTLAEGIKGETLISSLVNGKLTTRNFPHDISIRHNGLRLEVKFSNTRYAHDRSPTTRWGWAKILGESGDKIYDRLILIGNADTIYKKKYLDSESPYIVFDIPFNEIMPLTTSTGRFRSIQLLINPRKVRSVAAPLYDKYQITLSTLATRYGI